MYTALRLLVLGSVSGKAEAVEGGRSSGLNVLRLLKLNGEKYISCVRRLLPAFRFVRVSQRSDGKKRQQAPAS